MDLASRLKWLTGLIAWAKKRTAVAFARQEPRPAPLPRRRPLVASRPVRLEDRYHLVGGHDGDVLSDEAFWRLRDRLYQAIDTGTQSGATRIVHREAGRIAPGRPYFFLKPAGDRGWLFERSGAGWVVSRAEKIVLQNMFLRDGDPIDSVSLFAAEDRPAFPRVRSRALGNDLLSLSIYEQRTAERLGLVFSAAHR